MRVELAEQPGRVLRKLSRSDRRRVLDAIDDLAGGARPAGKRVKALAGWPGLLRYRIGDLRLIYEVHDLDDVVRILAIVRRRDLKTWLRRWR